MTKSELQEMEHIKQLLSRLQQMQLSVYGEPHMSVSLGVGGFRHSVDVYVHLYTDVERVCCTDERVEMFSLSVWNASRLNEDICNGCIALVNAHRELRG